MWHPLNILNRVENLLATLTIWLSNSFTHNVGLLWSWISWLNTNLSRVYLHSIFFGWWNFVNPEWIWLFSSLNIVRILDSIQFHTWTFSWAYISEHSHFYTFRYCCSPSYSSIFFNTLLQVHPSTYHTIVNAVLRSDRHQKYDENALERNNQAAR